MSAPSSAGFQPASDTTSALARWPVPPNWRWVSANQIARIVGGGTPPSRDEANFCSPGTGIPWITPADLTGYNSAYIEHGRRNLTAEGLANCGAKVVPAGSVLLSSRAPIGYCAIASNPVATSQGFKSLVFTDDISPDFIRSYLKHSKEYLHTLASGTTFPEISGRKVGEISIPLPPLPEQRLIVERLEALTARSRRARALLAEVPKQLAQARQSLLASAFRGDLTVNWRETNGGAAPTTCSLGDVAKLVSGYAFKSTDYAKAGVPLIRISNVAATGVDLTDCVFIPPDKANWKFRVEQGDLLVALSGATTGKFGVYSSDMPCLLNQRVGNLRVKDANRLSIGYRNYVLELLKPQIEETAYGGAQPNIAPHQIEGFQIPLPPLPEQHEIVRRLSAAFARLDAAAAAHAATVAELDRLDQSLLARAFSGAL